MVAAGLDLRRGGRQADKPGGQSAGRRRQGKQAEAEAEGKGWLAAWLARKRLMISAATVAKWRARERTHWHEAGGFVRAMRVMIIGYSSRRCCLCLLVVAAALMPAMKRSPRHAADSLLLPARGQTKNHVGAGVW